MGKVADWAEQGFTSIWLPPPSDSVSPQVRVLFAYYFSLIFVHLES
jgi:hypothetical protein